MNTTLKELLPSPPKRLAVAVSGGADSLCLAFLLSLWAPSQGVEVFALTVDHRLRPDSSQEAAYVAALTQAWDLSPVTFPLATPPQKRLQESARKQRYEAMALFCHDHDIQFLLLAHHLDDQLETFFMRLQEGSGPWGLGGMLPLSSFLGIQICRPFLSFPKTFLQEFLKAHGIFWKEDPSNHNPRFLRVRTRQFLGQLSSAVRQYWIQEFLKFHQKKWADESLCVDLLPQVCLFTQEAKALLDLTFWGKLPPLFQEIVLEKILRKVGGMSSHPLSQLSKKALLKNFKNPHPQTMTLGGCVLRPQENTVLIHREWQRIKPLCLKGSEKSLLWDHRFYLRFSDPHSLQGQLLLPQGQAYPLGDPLWEKRAAFPTLLEKNPPHSSLSSPFSSLRWL